MPLPHVASPSRVIFLLGQPRPKVTSPTAHWFPLYHRHVTFSDKRVSLYGSHCANCSGHFRRACKSTPRRPRARSHTQSSQLNGSPGCHGWCSRVLIPGQTVYRLYLIGVAYVRASQRRKHPLMVTTQALSRPSQLGGWGNGCDTCESVDTTTRQSELSSARPTVCDRVASRLLYVPPRPPPGTTFSAAGLHSPSLVRQIAPWVRQERPRFLKLRVLSCSICSTCG